MSPALAAVADLGYDGRVTVEDLSTTHPLPERTAAPVHLKAAVGDR